MTSTCQSSNEWKYETRKIGLNIFYSMKIQIQIHGNLMIKISWKNGHKINVFLTRNTILIAQYIAFLFKVQQYLLLKLSCFYRMLRSSRFQTILLLFRNGEGVDFWGHNLNVCMMKYVKWYIVM